MAKADRKRRVRSVTLDDKGVGKILAVGLEMEPAETSLSRLIDQAVAEFVRKRERKGESRGK